MLRATEAPTATAEQKGLLVTGKCVAMWSHMSVWLSSVNLKLRTLSAQFPCNCKLRILKSIALLEALGTT